MAINGVDSERPLAITGATVLDGTGNRPIATATVVIEHGRFAHVGPAALTPAPEGAQILDALRRIERVVARGRLYEPEPLWRVGAD